MRAPPAYQALRQQLRDDIAAGRYRDGARLPTESELVASHGVSRQTVRRAFQDLVADGAVYRVPGRGTYANDSSRYLRQLGSIEDLMSLSDDTTMEVLAGLRRRVDVDAASRLRLDDDVVYTVTFRRLHDGVPFVMTRVHLPESVAKTVLEAPELGDGAVGSISVPVSAMPAKPCCTLTRSVRLGAALADLAAAGAPTRGCAAVRDAAP